MVNRSPTRLSTTARKALLLSRMRRPAHSPTPRTLPVPTAQRHAPGDRFSRTHIERGHCNSGNSVGSDVCRERDQLDQAGEGEEARKRGPSCLLAAQRCAGDNRPDFHRARLADGWGVADKREWRYCLRQPALRAARTSTSTSELTRSGVPARWSRSSCGSASRRLLPRKQGSPTRCACWRERADGNGSSGAASIRKASRPAGTRQAAPRAFW